MKRIYACLLGEWVDITDKGQIRTYKPVDFFEGHIGPQDPSLLMGSSFKFEFVEIMYEKKFYKINPTLIQIVEEF